MEERLPRALEQLAALPTGPGLYNAIAETVRNGLACDWVCIGRIDGDTVEFIGAAHDGIAFLPSRIALSDTPCSLLCDARVTETILIIPDVRDSAAPGAAFLASHGVLSYCGAALRAPDGAVLGFVTALARAPCRDEPAARALLRVAADRATLVLLQEINLADLRDKEDRLALVQEISGFSECLWDIERDRLRVSAGWLERLGYTADELGPSHMGWLRLLAPADVPRLREFLVAHLKGEAITNVISYRMRTKQGEWRWFEVRGRVIARNAEGRALRMLGILLDVHESHQAAEALRQRTEFLEAAVRGSMDGLWDWNVQTDHAYFSPRFHELLGYEDGELPDSYAAFARSAYHPDDARQRVHYLAHALAHEPFLDRDVRMRTKQGEWRWFHSRAIIVRGADGAARRLVGSASDITERKQRETELADARRLLHDAIDHMDAGLVVSDADDRLVLCNARYAEMYGFAPDLLRPGTPLIELARDLHRRVPEYLAGRDLETAVAARMALMRARQGTWELKVGSHWHRISDHPAADGGLVSLRTDITAMKRTEHALRESEARLRSVLDQSPIGIFMSDEAGRSVFGNQTYLDLIEAGNAPVVDQIWSQRVHPDDRSRVVDYWYRYVKEGHGEYHAEYRSERSPGHYRVLRVHARPIRQEAQILGYVGTMQDVTEQRSHELQQQQAQKMEAIGHLTGGIAHDFNNLLASVLGYTRLARDSTARLHDDKLTRYLDSIREAGELARDLVTKMLAFSRDTPTHEIAPVPPLPVLNDAIRFLQPLIPANVRIRTEFDPVPGGILVDTVELYQALVNLALNARDAIAEHGTITVALRAPRVIHAQCASCRAQLAESFVEISVRDTGCGIPAEHRARLFEPFFTTKAVGKGSGMGLAVTHGVVHRAGGHLLLESSAGEGTTVSLLFRTAPLAATAVAPVAPTAPDPAVTTRRHTVMVVDDEPLLVNFWRELLEQHGYTVQPFTDSLAALDWARADGHQPDALVTDQTMPGMTGLELAAALHTDHPALPVVLCSGYSQHIDAQRLSVHGINHFFYKPVPLDQLLQILKELLQDRDTAPSAAPTAGHA